MSEKIEIPAEKLHEEMLKLRQGKHMDFLRSLTGMDWGEEGLGVVYHLEDTKTRENIVVSTRTTNREKPELPSVSDIWKGAEFNEREVYDYYGIRFIGHPDMRRLFLRDDWVGYPLRKDYDENLNPLRMTNEEAVDTTQYIEVQHDGSVIEKRETIFDEDEYIINIKITISLTTATNQNRTFCCLFHGHCRCSNCIINEMRCFFCYRNHVMLFFKFNMNSHLI